MAGRNYISLAKSTMQAGTVNDINGAIKKKNSVTNYRATESFSLDHLAKGRW